MVLENKLLIFNINTVEIFDINTTPTKGKGCKKCFPKSTIQKKQCWVLQLQQQLLLLQTFYTICVSKRYRKSKTF